MDAELLRTLLECDAKTGDLRWLPRDASLFSSVGSARRWHSNFCGKPALTAKNSNGYRIGIVLGRVVNAHRVVWILHNGPIPDGMHIDHLNGNRLDNRLANLRLATPSQNLRNAKMPRTNKSGVTGVSWAKRHKKWKAELRHDGKTLMLGMFDSLEDAAAARVAGNALYGYTARHGAAHTKGSHPSF
jgi:hypothetical protein